MDQYERDFKQENEYLSNTVDFILELIKGETADLDARKSQLIAARRTMWEDSAHSSRDFAKLTEMNQYLTEVLNQTASYSSTARQLEKYKKMLKSPYFGRFDFEEEGSEGTDRIYVGLHSIMDPKTHDIYVYDWRAPISSIFYRYELGQASFAAPNGAVSGNVTLKRQYKIQESKLKYFFDCSIKIDDEMLQEVLSRNASPKMRNIVETIQKEQDIIIRDTENELLIAQGVAGSGKTSIALHRVAFLLYHGLNKGISSKNILILSPNEIFGRYISGVLPELGEENVEQRTFEDMAEKIIGEDKALQTRGSMLENMICRQFEKQAEIQRKSLVFKGSSIFVEIIERFMKYFERNMVDFQDVYYHGRIVETRDKLRSFFLNNRVNMPAARKLKRMEKMIFDKLHPIQKERLRKIEKLVQGMEGHDFDIKPFSRLMALKETKALTQYIHRFTEIDCLKLYKVLFHKKGLIYKLAEGLELPDDFENMVEQTKENLSEEELKYEDIAPLVYLKLRMEGGDPYPDIRQLVVDEAQDYYPIHFHILKLLFPYSNYTIAGDVHQSIEKDVDFAIYDEIVDILSKRKSVKLLLNKSYRSSYEINVFNQRLQDAKQDFESFDRHEEMPSIITSGNMQEMLDMIEIDVEKYLKEGYGSVALICKTQQHAESIYGMLKGRLDAKPINSYTHEVEKGVVIISAYMSKGMEYDAVIVVDVSDDNYCTPLDKKLLYVACSRALHRLSLYHYGQKSRYL